MGTVGKQCPNPEFIVSLIEMGLIRTNDVKRKQFSIELDIKTNPASAVNEMEQIELILHRVVRALDSAQIEDYRAVVWFKAAIDDNKYRNVICDVFKPTHLAESFDETDDDGDYKIVVSNKDCKLCR